MKYSPRFVRPVSEYNFIRKSSLSIMNFIISSVVDITSCLKIQALDLSHLPVPWRYLQAKSLVEWEKLQSAPRWQF